MVKRIVFLLVGAVFSLVVACGGAPGSDETGSEGAIAGPSSSVTSPSPTTTTRSTAQHTTTTTATTITSLEGAPAWFSLDKALVSLSPFVGSFAVFEAAEIPTYRFRSSARSPGTSYESEGEVVVAATAIRQLITFQGDQVEWLRLVEEQREWVREPGGEWQELDEWFFGQELPLEYPLVEYGLAATMAGGILEVSDLAVVGEEEVNGRLALHLRAEESTSERNRTADLWIDQAGLLMKMTHIIELTDLQEPLSLEWSWELYDLGEPITIEPPA